MSSSMINVPYLGDATPQELRTSFKVFRVLLVLMSLNSLFQAFLISSKVGAKDWHNSSNASQAMLFCYCGVIISAFLANFFGSMAAIMNDIRAVQLTVVCYVLLSISYISKGVISTFYIGNHHSYSQLLTAGTLTLVCATFIAFLKVYEEMLKKIHILEISDVLMSDSAYAPLMENGENEMTHHNNATTMLV